MDLSLPHGLATLPAWLGILLTIAGPVALVLPIGHVMDSLFAPAGFQANAVVGAVKHGFVVETCAAVAALIVGSVLLVAIKLAFPYVGEPPMLSLAPFLRRMDLR